MPFFFFFTCFIYYGHWGNIKDECVSWKAQRMQEETGWKSCERCCGDTVPGHLMVRAVGNLVRGCTGHTEEPHSHLLWLTNSTVQVLPHQCLVKTTYVCPSTKNHRQTTWASVTAGMWIADWEVVDFYRTPGCWSLFLEGHQNSLLSPSANPDTLK